MSGAFASACVILVRTQGPVNLGLAARLCGNLGVTDLRLVAPLCTVNCADARKFATHSRNLLLDAPVFPDLGAAVADCGLVIGSSARRRGGDHGESLSPGEVPALVAARSPRRWALVFGNEADGLNDEEMLRCQAWLHLETIGPNTSYNLSHAVAITLYGLATAGLPKKTRAKPPADRAMVEHLYDYWLDCLERFHYFRRTSRARFAPQLRRLFNRLDLSIHDVQLLWGMLAQFHYHTFGDRGTRSTRPATTKKKTATKPRRRRAATAARPRRRT
jgi:TrmH family RNA methyltransferase